MTHSAPDVVRTHAVRPEGTLPFHRLLKAIRALEDAPARKPRVAIAAQRKVHLPIGALVAVLALLVPREQAVAQCGGFTPFQEKWVAGYHSTMAVTVNGLFVWGDAMGANGTTDILSPLQVLPANGYNYTGTIRLFTQGDGFEGDDPQSFVLTTTGLYVWGYEDHVLNTSVTTSTAFQATTLPAGVAATDVSFMTACHGVLAILTNAGNVYVRGSGSAALLGDGSGTNNAAWHQASISNVTQLKAVRNGIFAITASNTWYTWGPMTCLGNGAGEASRNTPTVMTAPFAGTPSMIALTNNDNGVSYYALNPADGKIHVLGENVNGRLGIGNTTDQTTWTRVRNPANTADLTNVTFINAVDNSPQHNSACAITSDSTVYFWGQNDGNMLSSSAAANQLLPIVPGGFTAGVDKAVYACMSGHYSLVQKRGLQRPCFVGHRQEGNVGDGSGADNYINTLNCTTIPDIDFCITMAAPVANDDSYAIADGVAISGQSIAGNDSDADNTNAQLTWSLVSGGTAASNGLLTFNANGTFNWVPIQGYAGASSFTYQVCDPSGLCDQATVTITVTAVNDPPMVSLNNANLVTNGSFEGGITGWTGNSGVDVQAATTFGAPTAPDGSTIAEVECWPLAPATTPAYLTQTITTVPGRTYLFSLHGVSRGSNVGDLGLVTVGGTDRMLMRFSAAWSNYAFLFTASGASTEIRLTSMGSLSGNMLPGDGDGFLVDHVQVRELNYSTSYTENAAGVPITVAGTSVYDMDNANMTTSTVTLTNPQTGDRLLVNGSAAASGTLASGITWTRTDNVVTLSGSFTKANYSTALSLVQFHSTSEDPNDTVTRDVTVTVNDGTNASNIAHTYITVTKVNDVPVAGDDSYTIAEGGAISGQSVMGNDSDLDHTNAQLTWSLVSGGTAASNGFLTFSSGTFSWTPFTDHTGTVTFTYQVCDPLGACDPATVTITVTAVNDPPMVALGNTNIVANGSFEGGATGWTSNSGGLDIQTAGTFGVPAAPDGPMTLEVEHSPIAPNSTPSYVTQNITTVVGRTYLFTMHAVTRNPYNTNDRGTVSIGGVDMMTVGLTSTWNSYAVLFTATGTSTEIRISSMGSLTGYTQPGDGNGFVLDDVQVREVNYTTSYTENAPGVAITLAATSVFDMDNANMTTSTVTLTNPQTGDRLLVGGSAAASGTLPSGIAWTRTDNVVTFTGSSGKANYSIALAAVQFHNTTEDPNDTVTRDITTTVSDGTSTSNTAHTYITVTKVNDAPVANDDSYTISEGGAITGQSVTGNDSDVDNTNAQLTWSVVSGGTATANGPLTFNTDGTFSWTPVYGYSGTASFTYQACDPGGLCDPATVTITVTPVNDPPMVALTSTNLVTNGSFENGGAGWSGNSGVETNPVVNYGAPAAPNGTWVAEVEGGWLAPVSTPSYVYQTITTIPGRTYLFSMGGVSRVGANTTDFARVTIGGVDRMTLGLASTWNTYAVLFTATAASTEIRITSLGSYAGSYPSPGDGHGVIIDDVQVRQVDHYTSYTENAPGTPLASAAPVVHDFDHANMATATITLTNPQIGDQLLVNGSSAASGTLASGIAWTRTDNVVTFTGASSKANYAAGLAQVQFHNTTEDPDNTVTRDVTVTVNDGTSLSNTAHTFITVSKVNDPPLAENDAHTTTKNVAITGQPIRGNDSDVDNTVAETTWTLEDGGTAAANGTLAVHENGSYTFTPNNEFLGTVSFTYRMCDPGVLCDVAEVTILVYSMLPVEMLGFQAWNDGPVNRTAWSTASEQNSERFEVERSADATDFTYLGELPAAGWSSGLLHYTFDDEAPLRGMNYYRIKQVDLDGSFAYSEVIGVLVAEGGSDCQVFLTDPAGLYALHCPWTQGTAVELLNVNGQQVLGATAIGEGRYEVDLRGLPAAMYITHIPNGDQVRTYKLMKP